MKVLIIGGGAVSEMFHIPSAVKLFGLKQVYLAEKSTIQLEKIKKNFHLTNTTDDYHIYLNNVDFVILATPPHTHVEIIKKCIAANLPVLCEKPLASSIRECKEIIQHNTKNVTIGLCHTYRFFPNRVKVRELIQKQFFGNHIEINIQEGDPIDWPVLSGYNFRKELVSGGVLLDAGVHSLDFLLWCLGEPLHIDYKDDSIGGIESNAELKAEFKNNVKVRFTISRTCSLSNTIQLIGDNNKVELDIFEMNEMVINGSNALRDTKQQKYNWADIGELQLQHFADAVLNKTSPMCSLEEGVNTIKWIEKCYVEKKSRLLPETVPLPGWKF